MELFVGTALIFRAWPRVSVPAGGLLFVLLAGASLIGTSRGVASCGCLGRVAMPPWVLLAFDAGAAVALLWRPRTARAGRADQATALDAACIGALFTGLAIGSILYPRLGPTATAVSPESVAAADAVILEPGRLQGRPFFLRPYIRIDADLSRGEWKVILARPGCRRRERALRSGPSGVDRRARGASPSSWPRRKLAGLCRSPARPSSAT